MRMLPQKIAKELIQPGDIILVDRGEWRGTRIYAKGRVSRIEDSTSPRRIMTEDEYGETTLTSWEHKDPGDAWLLERATQPKETLFDLDGEGVIIALV